MRSPTPPIDPRLLTKLRSKKADVREAAERHLASLGPDAVPALLELLEKESAVRARRRRWGVAMIGCYIGLALLLEYAGQGGHIGGLTGLMGAWAALFAATQLQKDAARTLAAYNDKRGVGYLAEALEYQDKAVVSEATSALIRLLPALTAADHALLSTAQRRCLDRALAKRTNTELALAILDAYEQIGDPASVAVVERLARGELRHSAPAVIERAADVLPAMRVRAEEVRAAQTLLRPIEEVGADVLLRPAEVGPLGPVEVLVRPVDTGESEAPNRETANETNPQTNRI